MNTLRMTDVVRTIHQLPSLPVVVSKLLTSLDQDGVNIDMLARDVALDQALTARTLQLANSTFYGMARQVATIREAIALLGLRTVRNLVNTIALIGTFSGSAHQAIDVRPFWRHAIAVAICARELAKRLDLNPDQAYTAGLLHDIGRLVLATQFAQAYEATMVYRAQHECSLTEAEEAVLGLDHAAVGHALTQHWKFPAVLQQAVALHHAPEMQDGHALSQVVCAADAIAHALDLSLYLDDLVPPLPTGLWQQLGLNDEDLLAVFENTEKQFTHVNLFLIPER